MNSSGIIPPREGVESLAAARKTLAGRDISSSHIMDAIIRTHSALESLFRQYLSQAKFIPNETRDSADDHRETSFPDLVRAMSAYGKPSLSGWESEILKLNQIRNQHAHPLSHPPQHQRKHLLMSSLPKEFTNGIRNLIYQRASSALPHRKAQISQKKQNQGKL